MSSYPSRQFPAKFIVLFISIFLIISCTKSTKIMTSKNFDKQKSNIAIMQFMNSGFKSGYDSYISDKLAYTLMEKKFAIIERQRIQNIFSELQLEASGMLSKSDLNKIGKLSDVDIICTGTAYYQIARGGIWPYTIMVRFVDVKSGEVVFMAECTNEKDWDGSYCVNKIANNLSQIGK
jgi:curli biogenesis system outer membrane secretion channel CsgG